MFLDTKIFYSHYIVIIFNYMKKYIYYLIKMFKYKHCIYIQFYIQLKMLYLFYNYISKLNLNIYLY